MKLGSLLSNLDHPLRSGRVVLSHSTTRVISINWNEINLTAILWLQCGNSSILKDRWENALLMRRIPIWMRWLAAWCERCLISHFTVQFKPCYITPMVDKACLNRTGKALEKKYAYYVCKWASENTRFKWSEFPIDLSFFLFKLRLLTSLDAPSHRGHSAQMSVCLMLVSF